MEKCCSECPDPRVGQSLCTGCNKWLCFQCTDLHQHERSPGPMAEQQQQRPGSPPPPPPPPPPPSETGSGCRGHAVVMCSLHKQEALELFCETCDLMACSICLLSTHKDHRLVHVGKAMQDQRWLLENLLARVEEKRSAVETTAKQIQDRLHGVRNTQRKAENQIKMAKMIMMNELNKRANLLIEQLESISSDFKQRLEDHLQGAIELCSQLDHMQNFITWATAHHRRNPLLFSKDLIALQLQRLLEPLMHTDSWVPLKIKFNWDASYWTKQISTLGQLTVAGGSRPYSEGMGRTGILRPVPQPVPCLSVPALCPAVREQGCAAYQAFCQPQICCLHCVVPQTTSLPALQPGKPTCPGRCSQTRCPWEAEGVAPPRPFPPSPAQQQRLQNPIALPSGDSAQLSPSGAPSRQTTADPCQRDGEANGSEQPGADGGSREKLRSETQTPQRVLEPERRVSSEQVLVQLHCPPSQTAGTGSDPWPQQAPTGPRLSDTSRVDRRPSALELRTVDQGGGEGHSESTGDMKARTQSCPAEPQRTSPPERPAKDKPSGTGRSLSTAMEQERTALQPEQYELREKGMQPVRRMSRGLPNVSCPPTQSQASQPTYKTEPDNICVYTRKNSRLKHRKKYKISRNVYSREASKSSEGSKVPVVCLERLKILVSRLPPQGRAQMGLPADSELKSERAVTQKLERDLHAERVSTEELLQVDESRFLSSSQLPSEKLHGISSPSSPASPAPPERESLNRPDSTPPPQSTDPEGTDTEQEAPSDPRSVPTSESLPESTTETDPGSEAEVDSEVQPESDLSFESEPQAEGDSDSDLESERRGGAELSTPSESSFRSEAGSMAEVTVRVNSGSELEAGEETAQAAVKAGSEVACERVTEGQASAEPAEEMESEDFCAVCLIGGELLCCDRCPKVYHLSCHIPSLLRFPTGDWVCSLCRGYQQPVAERDFESGQPTTPASPYGLSACEQRKCEKLTLLILSNILSAPFHEPVSPLARHYYQIIKKPMDLSVIRSKLSQASTTHYNSPEEFVADVLLMFKNCAKFNYPDSEVAQAGRSLEVFFSSKLREVFPEHSFPALQEDSDSEEYEEVPRGSEEGFLWPERKEQGHRKRKRRHSHNPRKNYF